MTLFFRVLIYTAVSDIDGQEDQDADSKHQYKVGSIKVIWIGKDNHVDGFGVDNSFSSCLKAKDILIACTHDALPGHDEFAYIN